MAVWMTLKEAAQLTGIPKPRILELAKDLQVGFTRNADGVLVVDAEALEAHVPAALSAPTEDDAGEWLRERDARRLIGLQYSTSAWWAHHSGNYERKKINGVYHYPLAWCEEQRSLRSYAKHPLCTEEEHSAEPPHRMDPTLLSKEAMRHLRREIRIFLAARPGLTMQSLSRAAGLHAGEVAELLRHGRRNACRSTTAAALRKAMREWPSEESAAEPELDIETVRQQWNEMPAELKRMARIAVGAFVTEAWPEALDEDVLSLVFPPECSFHYTQVSGPYRDVVQKALERVYGRPLTVRCRIADPEQDTDMTMPEWTSAEQPPSPPIAQADEPVPNEDDFDLTMAEAAKFLGLTYYHARKYIPKVDCTALRKKYINRGPGYRLAVSARWLATHRAEILALKQADDAAQNDAETKRNVHAKRFAELLRTPTQLSPLPQEPPTSSPTTPSRGLIARLFGWATRRS